MALQSIERALELEPTRVDALVTAGVLYERRGKRERARQLLDAALEINGDDVIALTARGTLEMGAGSAYAAHRFFERAHELGNTPMTAANLGAACIALGQPETARQILSSADGLVAPAELHANLAFALLQAGEVEQARASFNKALASGADARNHRVVALDRLVSDAEGKQHEDAMAAVEGGPR